MFKILTSLQKASHLSYFAQNLKHLRKRSAKTQEQLGQELRIGRTTIANYESGFSGPTDPDVLVRLSRLFGVSIDELLTRDLSQAFGSANGTAQALFGNTTTIAHPNSVTMRVPLVGRTEARNYLANAGDPRYLGTLPHFGIPGLLPDDYRIFEVLDDALAPRFVPGDLVLCRRADSAMQLHPGALCMLVCPAQGLLLRRVRSYDHDGLHLDASLQGPGLLPPEMIREAWLVEWLISTRLNTPPQDVSSQLESLEEQLRGLRHQIQQTTSTIKPPAL